MAHDVLSWEARRPEKFTRRQRHDQECKGTLDALQQSINEAILESNDVAAAMAALKRTGKCPVFSIEVALEDAPVPAAEPVAPSTLSEELVLSDADVQFLAAIGITDPSWCCSTPQSGTA